MGGIANDIQDSRSHICCQGVAAPTDIQKKKKKKKKEQDKVRNANLMRDMNLDFACIVFHRGNSVIVVCGSAVVIAYDSVYDSSVLLHILGFVICMHAQTLWPSYLA